jgi:hypothetical protein
MAKIQEQVIVIKVSKLIKDRQPDATVALVDDEFLANAESVLQELVGDNCTVEVVADL